MQSEPDDAAAVIVAAAAAAALNVTTPCLSTDDNRRRVVPLWSRPVVAVVMISRTKLVRINRGRAAAAGFLGCRDD